MTEPIFFRPAESLSAGEIATLTGATLSDPSRSGVVIRNVAPIDSAGPSDLAFLENVRYAAGLQSTKAGACLITERLAADAPPGLLLLVSAQPYRSFVTVTRKLFPQALRPSSLVEAEGVMPGASVHPKARLEDGVTVEPGAVIGPRAEIGAGTLIGAGAVIGADVRVGRDGSIGAHCSVAHALIGDRVIMHPGCRIGQDGFGYLMSPRGHAKVPQVGRVIIQDDVEIGAGTAIDRGAIRDTVIGEGTKIDNLVQIGHNVSVGRHCVIVSHVALAGSVTLEDFVAIGGCTTINNHVTVGMGAQIAGYSAVNVDIPPGGRYGGIPAKPAKLWMREIAAVERLVRRSNDKSKTEHESGR
ncbi:UDP-3-O-(3-hydroxymyristoyl)glucosamine N-acyltransferase [Pseudorhodoplanes sp.]|uniref:UDP-3-O-(3-hydroxymyristoyl)glucosamine N-acyltransferase n=1 Tax=Pseudorhodoplanes sp. TaxID=1934341 RepID=UPI002B8A8AFF|nr:UDP-3-O-(3-hydroxymyristoyl)glucosamine N-acyltransferase [Pseudorhodoplanes sp.]HWV42294.1 UDP-3-O-(3-hydroxymyristoyl)glucosamine N-acyltransferase [Pseudorhodoplanes sp.]